MNNPQYLGLYIEPLNCVNNNNKLIYKKEIFLFLLKGNFLFAIRYLILH